MLCKQVNIISVGENGFLLLNALFHKRPKQHALQRALEALTRSYVLGKSTIGDSSEVTLWT